MSDFSRLGVIKFKASDRKGFEKSAKFFYEKYLQGKSIKLCNLLRISMRCSASTWMYPGNDAMCFLVVTNRKHEPAADFYLYS